MTTLYVTGFDYQSTSVRDLVLLFEKHVKPVTYARTFHHSRNVRQYTQKPLPFAFVEYATVHQCEAARKALNFQSIKGRTLSVRLCDNHIQPSLTRYVLFFVKDYENT